MNRQAFGIIVATLWLSAPVLAQEPTSAGSTVEPMAETFLDSTAIAVLPVEVRSNNPNYPQLAEAVYNEFLDQLRKIDGIHVIDPALVEPYSTYSLEPEEIARQLGAATVLESSVASRPPVYRVGFAFIDVQTGKHHISGGMRSKEEWGPGRSLDERVLEMIADSMQSVETGIFPDRRNPINYELVRADARSRFLNASLSVEDRLAALNELRPGFILGYPRQYADGGASLTGEVAIAAAQLATESNDPVVRSRIWRTMAAVADPNLVDPLLHALAYDVDARVRTSAAAALAVHIEASGVRDALHDAKTNDPDRLVRKAASLSMATEEEYRDLLKETAMDTSLPERERYLALNSLSVMDGEKGITEDAEFAAAMVGFVTTAKRLRHRSQGWYMIGRIGGAAMVPVLIDALSNEPEETVRESIASSLSKLIDEPGVRDALAKAQSDDPSPLVRAAAKCALQGGGWC